MYKELPCPCLSFFLPPLTCPSVIFPHLPACSRIFPHLPSPPFFSFRPRPSALALFFLLCLVPLSISPSSLTPLHSFPPPFSVPPHCAFPFLSSFLLPLPAHSSLSLLPPPHSLLLAVLYRIFKFATRDFVGKTISNKKEQQTTSKRHLSVLLRCQNMQ